METRNFYQGAPITSVAELLEQEFIFTNGKVLHKGWFQSWPLRSVVRYIQQETLFKAIKKMEVGF